ncbi:MAG: DivIVA domain-containing protein [Erysipelotrichaceae bacterium]
MNKIGKLDAQSIYQKEFNIEFKGYSATEVDAFLDVVIKDYQQFEEAFTSLREQIEQLQKINLQYQNRLTELAGRLEAGETGEPQGNSVDLLKRLAKLEQEVYKR